MGEPSSFEDRLRYRREARDRELAEREIPLLKMSVVKRKQIRASLLMIPLLFVWVGALFGVIGVIRSLMVERTPYYGLLILAWMVLSFVLYGLAWGRVQRAFGLICPYCDTTFVFTGMKDPNRTAEAAAEDVRRCMKCHAAVIDLNA